jgi:hypothetical protein
MAAKDPRVDVTFSLAHTLQVLERTPSVLDALLRGLDPAWHRADEGPETWSPFDVVGHLLHGEETDWIPRARIILEHGEEMTFEPFDRFAQLTRFAGRSLEGLLDRFHEARRESLATLRGWDLAPEQLALLGRHPELGTVTLGELLATWTVHDLGHVAQITRVMSKRYADEVGPWRAYLPVLER